MGIEKRWASVARTIALVREGELYYIGQDSRPSEERSQHSQTKRKNARRKTARLDAERGHRKTSRPDPSIHCLDFDTPFQYGEGTFFESGTGRQLCASKTAATAVAIAGP